MRWLLWVLPVRLFLWAVTLFLLSQVVVFVRGRPVELDERIVALANQAATDAIATLPEYRAQPRRIGVVHFVQDRTRQVTRAMAVQFAAPANWIVDDRSVIQRFLGDVGRSVAQASTPEEVAFAARDVELDWLVMGRIHEAISTEAEARLDMSVWIYDLGQGEWVYRDRVAKVQRAERSPAVAFRGFWGRAWVRVLVWILLVALFPWLTAPLIFRVVDHKSNWLSAGLLGGYSGAGLLLMFALMRFDVSGRISAIWIALALLVTTIYNYWACEKIAEEAA